MSHMHFKLILHILLFCSLVSSSETSSKPGITSSLDNAVIEESKEVFAHYVLQALNSSVIDVLKWEDGSFKDN